MGGSQIGIDTLTVMITRMRTLPCDFDKVGSNAFAGNNDFIIFARCFKHQSNVIICGQFSRKGFTVIAAGFFIADQQHVNIAYISLLRMNFAQCT